jgi:hypothetical protein
LQLTSLRKEFAVLEKEKKEGEAAAAVEAAGLRSELRQMERQVRMEEEEGGVWDGMGRGGYMFVCCEQIGRWLTTLKIVSVYGARN